jgi:hypothetical protein
MAGENKRTREDRKRGLLIFNRFALYFLIELIYTFVLINPATLALYQFLAIRASKPLLSANLLNINNILFSPSLSSRCSVSLPLFSPVPVIN